MRPTVRGSGPVLLLCPGGNGDPSGVAALAGHLDDAWTVVTYERRDHPPEAAAAGAQPPTIADHAADAAAVLAEVGAGRAAVFGSSFGGLVATELLLRHPGLVTTAVLHEPPLRGLLDAAEGATALHDQQAMHAAYADDPRSAGALAMRVTGSRFDEWEDGAVPPPRDPGRALVMQRFFRWVAPAAEHYRPDPTAIRDAGTTIVPATGTTATGHFPYRCAEALAELLGVEAARFPGAHTGMITHPRGFAERLRAALTRS